MNNDNNKDYIIRSYLDCDADKIGEFDRLSELSYRYNADFVKDNILCAVNANGDVLGVGHLEPHDSWQLINKAGIKSDFEYKLLLGISLNLQYPCSYKIKEDLLKSLISRGREIGEKYPGKRIKAIKWLYSYENNEMDFYLSKGFGANNNTFVLKYDLTQNIPEVPKPEGITVTIRRLETEEQLKEQYEAEAAAFSGVVWSMNRFRWFRGAPEWICVSVFEGTRLIGNTMTWMISNERSATENIFVLPEWRNKGVARYMITEALKYLKSQGKSMATLSVHGDNMNAISLYKALGYKMLGIMLEFGYDL